MKIEVLVEEQFVALELKYIDGTDRALDEAATASMETKIFLGISVLALLLSACNASAPTQIVLPNPIANQRTPSSQVTPAPVSTSLAFTVTPQPTQIPELLVPRTMDDLKKLALDFLNQGGEADKLVNLLQADGIVAEAQTVDIDGDQIPEVVLTAGIGGTSDEIGSGIWIFSRSNAHYQVLSVTQDGLLSQTHIVAIDDVNNDGRAEVVAKGDYATPLGACELMIFVIGWRDSRFINYIDPFSNVHCPAELNLGKRDSRGFRELLAQGSTSSTIGDGPGRGVTITFGLDNGKYQASSVAYAPSNLRIHVVQDAQIAFANANYSLAIQLSEKAAHDATLQDWALSSDDNSKYQQAYALYWLFAVYLDMNEKQKAEAVLTEMATKYPAGTPGSELVDIARKYRDELAVGVDAQTACGNLYDFIEKSVVVNWTRLDWGDSNRVVNLCPYPVR